MIDLHNREVIGPALSPDPTTGVVTEAIDLAAARGPIRPDVVFHSDRGTHTHPTSSATP